MQLGFDEIYVVVERKIMYLHNQVLYDSRTADEKVKWLMINEDIEAEKMSLEQYIERIDPDPR